MIQQLRCDESGPVPRYATRPDLDPAMICARRSKRRSVSPRILATPHRCVELVADCSAGLLEGWTGQGLQVFHCACFSHSHIFFSELERNCASGANKKALNMVGYGNMIGPFIQKCNNPTNPIGQPKPLWRPLCTRVWTGHAATGNQYAGMWPFIFFVAAFFVAATWLNIIENLL